MGTFTPWTMVIDLGIISALILVGKYIRVKINIVQKFLIPPSVLAGVIGLILGPEVLGWLPLSGNLGTYAGILKCMDHYAIAYILIAPIEISLITFAPIIFCNGYGLWFSLACLIVGISVTAYMLIDRRRSRDF